MAIRPSNTDSLSSFRDICRLALPDFRPFRLCMSGTERRLIQVYPV